MDAVKHAIARRFVVPCDISNPKDFAKGVGSLLNVAADMAVSSASAVVERMKRDGVQVWKFPRKAKPKKSVIKLSEDELLLLCGSRDVAVSDIEEVRMGQHSSVFEQHMREGNKPEGKDLSDLSLSVVYGPNATLDLAASDKASFDVLKECLDIVMRRQRSPLIGLLGHHWRAIGKETLDYARTEKLLRKLNMNAKGSFVKAKLKEVDENKNKRLDFSEALVLIERLCQRETLKELFEKHAKGGRDDRMDAGELHAFLTTVQKEPNVTIKHCEDLITAVEAHAKRVGLSLLGFEKFMTGAFNTLIDPSRAANVVDDMDQPFAHYWIDSSHNTYLLQGQLVGESSVEAYIRAFKNGCRCVELDCWESEGSKWGGEPVIFHGHTLTTKIRFRDVIKVCKKYGHAVSEYPVILSIENHCGKEQETKMAEIMREIFGDDLATPFLEKGAKGLPSPNSLRGKFLVKSKPAQSKEDKEAGKSVWDCPFGEVCYLRNTHFQNFEHSAENGQVWQMSSFVETKVSDLLDEEDRGQKFIDYNKRQLARVYPSGAAVDSSNYDPFPALSAGCQIVALNYQRTDEKEWWQYMGRFNDNGHSGYILKPQGMLHDGPYVPGGRYKHLKLRIISARMLPKSGKGSKEGSGEIVDPYVRIYVSGAKADRREEKTKFLNDQGFAPKWDETFEFDFTASDLAVLTLAIKDEDVGGDDNLCQYSCPVNSMRQGYRIINTFYNMKGDHLPPMVNLLVYVELS